MTIYIYIASSVYPFHADVLQLHICSTHLLDGPPSTKYMNSQKVYAMKIINNSLEHSYMTEKGSAPSGSQTWCQMDHHHLNIWILIMFMLWKEYPDFSWTRFKFLLKQKIFLFGDKLLPVIQHGFLRSAENVYIHNFLVLFGKILFPIILLYYEYKHFLQTW